MGRETAAILTGWPCSNTGCGFAGSSGEVCSSEEDELYTQEGTCWVALFGGGGTEHTVCSEAACGYLSCRIKHWHEQEERWAR